MQDPEQTRQYQRLTATWGIFPLKNWTVITIRGADRTSFLHNMCTQEIRQRAPGHGCELFLTDVKGHLIGHLFLQVGDHELRLLAVPGQASAILQHLDRYIIREDVVLADETGQWSSLLVLGREAGTRLTGLAENGPPEGLSILKQPWQSTRLVPANNPSERPFWQVARTDWLKVPCYLLQAPANLPGSSPIQPGPPAEICQALAAAGAQHCSTAVWNALRIESGLPLWNVDFSQANLPQEVARNEQAISFRKGCYLGQETIARIDALGHVNRQLTTLRFDGHQIPGIGTPLRAKDKQVGTVTSACWSPAWNGPLALAMVGSDQQAPGTPMDSEVGTASVLPMKY